MILTLMRHYEVEARYRSTYIGWTDARLSEEGVLHARSEKPRLKSSITRHDRIYCSDLIRCKKSLEYLGIDSRRVEYRRSLREKSFGRAEGMAFETIQKTYGIVYEDFLQWIEAIGGESVPEFLQRIELFLHDEIFNRPDHNIFIMTHAGVIHAIHAIIQKIPLEETFADKLHYGDIRTLDMEKITPSEN